MAAEVLGADGLRRLADQLQTLSELTETLTYRLLELEEKVAAVDLQLEPLLSGRGEPALLAEDTELRLDETESRLARLEAMLINGRGASLSLVGAHKLEGPAALDGQEDAELEPQDHFPDGDFEQSFLDEEPLFGGLDQEDTGVLGEADAGNDETPRETASDAEFEADDLDAQQRLIA